MKKTISFLIIICMLLGSFPPMERSYGATYQVNESNYPGFSKLSDYQKSLIDQLFIQKVKLQNSKGMYIAIKPLENQHVTVYNWNHLTAKGFGQEGPFKGTWVDGKLLGAGEYRYLGYDYYGNPVTNDKYTNGPVVGDRNVFDLPNYTYYKQDKAKDSWKRITDPTATNHMLEKPFISEDEYRDTNPKHWSMKSLLSKTLTGSTGYGGTLTDNSLKPYLIMQTPASLNEKGSMRAYGRGKNANGDYVTAYNTFNVEPIEKQFKHVFAIIPYEDKACTKVASKIEIPQDKESIKVYVKFNSDINMESLKLGGQETKYIEYVTHTMIANGNVNGERKVDVKDLSNVKKVNNVYEVTLNKKDYSSKPKTIQFKGVSTPKIRYSLIHNITVEASANVQVAVADPTKLKADFTIHHGTEDKTDDLIKINTQTIESPIALALKDASVVPANNAVVNYNWFIFNHTKNEIDYFGYTKDTSFTIDPTNKAAYVKDGVVTFKELVVDKVGNREWAEHKVTITSSIPIPPPPEKEVLPEATIAAPGTIRAGQRCGISGEGVSANGPIVSYDFDLASSFKIIEDNLKDKTGTFLSFDHSVNNEWTENSNLTVTDSAGKQDSDDAKTYVKHPIEPVFKTRGVYKVNRTITLDSTESTGTEFYPIDKVTWTIKPMDGQSINVVKPHVPSKITGNVMTVEGAAPNVDFKQLGRYEVWMDVHSTCTFAGETTRTASKQVYGIITIAPDEAPIAKLSVPRVTIRDYDDAKQANITVWDESYSPDGDSIGKRRFYARRDTDNDKKTDDETWELIYEGTNSNVDYKTPYVGFYEFKIEVEEANDSITSPFWNAVTDTLRANSDIQPLIEKQTEVMNVAPITSIMAERKKLDLVLVTDYEGSDYTALKAELDILTKDLFEKGVDIEVKVFKDKIRNGSVKAPVYRYIRYAHVNYTTEYTRNADIQYQTTRMDDRFVWEGRSQLETDYLPTLSPIPATYTTSYYNKADPTSGVQVNQGMTVTVNAPTDPYLKSGQTNIITELVYSNQYNSGLEKRQNMRDMSVSVDNYYTKENIVSYSDIALYTMNLDLLRQTVNYRDGSDRQMIFVMKTGDSLTTLNQTFADYVKQNNIVVSAVNGFDMASQYGGLAVQSAEFVYSNELPGDQPTESYKKADWYAKVNRIAEPIGMAFKTEDGKSYQIQSYKDPNYPTVLSNYTFRDFQNEFRSYYLYKNYYGENDSYDLIAGYDNRNETFQYDKTRYDYYNTSNNFSTVRYERRDREYTRAANMSDFNTFIIRETNQFYETKNFYYAVRYGNLYKWTIESGKVNDTSIDGGKLEGNNVEVVFTGKVIEGGGYPSNSLTNLVAFYYKDLNKTRILWDTYNIWTGTYSYTPHELWLDGNVSYVKSYPTGMTRVYPYKRGEGAVRNVYAQHSIDFVMSTGVSRRITSIENLMSGENKVGNNAVYFLSLPDGYKAIQVPNMSRRDFSDAYYYWNSRIYEYRDTPSSVSSLFMSPTGDLYMSDSNWDSAGNLSLYPITQGLNIKKFNIYTQQQEGRATMHLVALTHDGKLYSGAIGSGVLTPQNMTNLVKDPRTLAQPVVNAMSMRKLLNQSSANRISGSFGEFGNRLRADYDYLKYQTKVTLLLGETLKYDQLYYDREGDPLYDSAISIQHDQNALESPIGTDPNNGQTLKNWDNKLTKTGLYKIQPKVQDSPSSDDNFSDYRLWNKDDTTIEVLVHRKPIASMKLSMTPTAPFIVTARDSNSRDLDHISMASPLRGITEVEWGIKKLYDDEWVISKGAIGTTLSKSLETGETYIVSYRVKDVEGAWSDPVTEQIVAGMNLLLDGKLKPENPTHNLSKFQTGNNVVFHELWTSYPLAHHLEIQMYDGATPILSKVTLRKEWGQVRAENYPERDWVDVPFNIPRTINGVPLADKTYNFIVTAYDTSNTNIKKQKTFQVTTISNTAPTVSIVTHMPNPAYVGDNINLNVAVTDQDLDKLTLTVKLFNSSNALISSKTINVNPEGGGYKNQILSMLNDIDAGNYRAEATVNDGMISVDSQPYYFTVGNITLTGYLSPNPVTAGYYVTIVGNTTGFCDRVQATINTGKLAGTTINLTPTKSLPVLDNTWVGKFKTDPYEPDGNIPITLKAYRGNRSISIQLILIIKGSVYERKATTKQS